MKKIKTCLAGVGALMIAYLIVAVVLFFFTLFAVVFTGVSPNGGFDMLLAIAKIPLHISALCFLIILYSISFFCKSRERIMKFINNLYE